MTLWSTGDHQLAESLTSPYAVEVSAVAFSPRSDTVAAAIVNHVVLWQLPAQAPTTRAVTPLVVPVASRLLYSLAFSPDGSMVAAGGTGVVELVRTATGSVSVLGGPTGAVYGVSFSREGTSLAGACADRTIHLWKLPNNPLAGLPIAQAPGAVAAVAVSPDSHTIVAGGSLDDGKGFIDFIDLPDTATQAPASSHVLDLAYPVGRVAFANEADVVAVASGDQIELWDPTTRTLIRSWPVPVLLTTGARARPVSVTGMSIGALAINRDGSRLLSGNAQGDVELWSLGPDGVHGQLLTRDFGVVYAAAFSPDGGAVAVGGSDHTIQIWALGTGSPMQTLPLDDSVFGLAFSPSGHQLAAASADSTIRLWASRTSRWIQAKVLLGHLSLVRSVAFSPDGQTLVSGGFDNSVRLWDDAAGEEIGAPYTEDTMSVEGVAFSPNGQFLVSGSVDGSVRQWQAPSVPPSFSTLRRQVCAFVGAGLSRSEWQEYAPTISFRPTCSTATPG